MRNQNTIVIKNKKQTKQNLGPLFKVGKHALNSVTIPLNDILLHLALHLMRNLKSLSFSHII